MLPRKYRLTADRDISKVFRRGKPASAGPFGLRCVPNGKDHARFAFVVGTKVSKKAVVRNRLKRQMREAVHALLKDARPGMDVVLMVRKEAVDMPYAQITESISKMFRLAGLLGKAK